MELEEKDIDLDLRGTKTSRVYPNHEPARQQKKTFVLKQIPLDDNAKALIPSVFMQSYVYKKNINETMYYYNESDVQHIVRCLLGDAIATCNAIMEVCENPIKLRYQFEANIWSKKPDHFVVFDIHSKVPLVTIEVKKPIDTSLDKFEKVHGQGFDYLSISKVQGNKFPMHITTTLAEAYVAWLPETDPNQDKRYVDVHNATQDDDINGMQEHWKKIFQSTQRSAGTDTLTQSPLQVPAAAAEEEVIPATPKEKVIVRSICTSQVFKGHQLFQVMVNTILCSLRGSSSSHRVPLLRKGDRVTQTALKLTATGFQWVDLDAVVKGPLPSQSTLQSIWRKLGFSNQTMYAVGLLDFGSTSKLFRVITSKGYEGAAKVYVLKHDYVLKYDK
eukprot:scaffold155426_cov45-Attheya_sp.AAC.1